MSLLWFRRSRTKNGKQEGEPQPIAPAHKAGVAPRLRGVLLLNLQPHEGIDRIEGAPPLGPRVDIITAVQTAVPGMAFRPDGKGELVSTDHRVTIDLGAEHIVHAAVVAAEGETGIALLRALLERQRWRAYAPRAGVFIEPDALALFAAPDNV
jgi:hypothetical protein